MKATKRPVRDGLRLASIAPLSTRSPEIRTTTDKPLIRGPLAKTDRAPIISQINPPAIMKKPDTRSARRSQVGLIAFSSMCRIPANAPRLRQRVAPFQFL